MRLIRALFWLSDACAWLLLSVAVFLAVLFPVLGPSADRADHVPVSWPSTLLASVFFLSVAVLCYCITRRQSLAVLFLAALLFVAGVSASLVLGFLYAVPVLVVFGTPMLLALNEARAHVSANET